MANTTNRVVLSGTFADVDVTIGQNLKVDNFGKIRTTDGDSLSDALNGKVNAVSGTSAGSGCRVTVNSQGLVTSVRELYTTDLPTEVQEALDVVANLGRPMRIIGKTETAITDGETMESIAIVGRGTVTLKDGDVVISKPEASSPSVEFLYVKDEGAAVGFFTKLGDEGAYIPKGGLTDSDVPTGEISISKIDGLDAALDDKADAQNISPLTTSSVCKLTFNSQGVITGGSVATATDIPGLDDKVDKNDEITGGTFCKVAVDAKGLVTAGYTTLDASDITGLSEALTGVVSNDALSGESIDVGNTSTASAALSALVVEMGRLLGADVHYSLTNCTVDVQGGPFYYTGSPIEPSVVVTNNGTWTVPSAGYDTSYANNTDAGTAMVTVEGSDGFFTDTQSASFTILPYNAADDNDNKIRYVTNIGELVYDGAADGKISSNLLMNIYHGRHLVLGRDYVFTDTLTGEPYVGHRCIVSFMGNYTGIKIFDFSVKRFDIANATISVESAIWNGTAYMPSYSVIYPRWGRDPWNLMENTDFTVSFSGNSNIEGVAQATFTGTNGCSGTVSRTFTKVARALDGLSFVAPLTQTETGSALEPDFESIEFNGIGLVNGTDYTLSYSDNVNPGTASVTAFGIGNYTGSLAATFEITAAS